MKRSDKEFKKYVQDIRRKMPEYNGDRRVIVLGEDTKAGQRIIAMGSRSEGYTLGQVYSYWSEAKQRAYDEVFEMYVCSPGSDAFSICSHNCQAFTVSWLDYAGLHFMTSKTEYIVIFNE
jgi:hypothetical protein